MGLFAPELVLYVAWQHWRSAKELAAQVNACFEKQNMRKEDGSERKHRWTIVHGFYAGMGGFVFDTVHENLPPYIPDSPRLSVTGEGILGLAQLGHLPDIPQDFILDKSKADNVTKSLVVVQASWLLVQCIIRLAAHLPLTLLEINTLAHVVCVLGIYCLWWKKPLDIHDPTVLSGDWVRSVCAYMWERSTILPSWRVYWKDLSYPTRNGQPSDPLQQRRRELTSTFDGSVFGGADTLVNLRIMNWPAERMGSVKFKGQRWDQFTFGMAPLLYGGLHAAAFNEHFPSSIERILWRVSTVYIASGIFVGMFLSSLSIDESDEQRAKKADSLLLMIIIPFFFLLYIGGIITYIAARIFVVVECFISLREVPPAMYQTPIWTQYIPHL